MSNNTAKAIFIPLGAILLVGGTLLPRAGSGGRGSRTHSSGVLLCTGGTTVREPQLAGRDYGRRGRPFAVMGTTDSAVSAGAFAAHDWTRVCFGFTAE